MAALLVLLVSRGMGQQSAPDPGVLARLYRDRGYAAVEAAFGRVRDWVRFRAEVDRAIADIPIDAGAAFSLEAAIRATAAGGRNVSAPEFAAASQLIRATLKRLPASRVSPEFERQWLLAAIALVQGMGNEVPAWGRFRDLYEHATRRFPRDASLRFARLVHDEQELIAWHLVQGVEVARADSQSESDALRVARQKMGDVANGYRELASDPLIGGDAMVRAAMMQLMRREFQLALSELSVRAASSDDSSIAFLRWLFEGHALAELGRWREAVGAYERALALQAGAQSAQLSLAGVLYVDGQVDGAAERVGSMLRNPVDDDPWGWYHYGEFRRLSVRVRAMREAIQ